MIRRHPMALLATAAVVTSLMGCSGSDDADAHQKACRTYLLEVQGQDKEAATLLADAARDNTWDNEPINAALDKVRTAGTDAGSFDALSDDDFDVFSALLDATGTAYARTNPDGGDGISDDTASQFSAAAEKARDACDSS